MRRGVMAALRAASEPLTSLDIARQVIAVRKLSEDAPRGGDRGPGEALFSVGKVTEAAARRTSK